MHKQTTSRWSHFLLRVPWTKSLLEYSECECVSSFHFTEVNDVPGKELHVADALSRMQSDNPDRQETVPEEEMNIYDSILDALPVSDVKLTEIKEAQDEDPVWKQIKKYYIEGWPDKLHFHDAVKPYWSVRGELSVLHGILLNSSRIVVPSAMRLQVLDKVHEGHQGIGKCRERAKEFRLVARSQP